MNEVENEMNGEGRILVRPSGTEPLVRVMVEAATNEDAERYAQTIADKRKNGIKLIVPFKIHTLFKVKAVELKTLESI